ncbi:hypothetical protein M378DRAFT_662576 [Amanita muscaria Koide BX008]|uniref:Uncharacterized protein n=1 Tax=Amanita muscaria (strain Koide BX008) TaxID=946122 RepID=A0A0C2SM25_AMAMK|nr:hypothetical protein M378DRAFT_662576 [Amanita muscaria Koide BX008]
MVHGRMRYPDGSYHGEDNDGMEDFARDVMVELMGNAVETLKMADERESKEVSWLVGSLNGSGSTNGSSTTSTQSPPTIVLNGEPGDPRQIQASSECGMVQPVQGLSCFVTATACKHVTASMPPGPEVNRPEFDHKLHGWTQKQLPKNTDQTCREAECEALESPEKTGVPEYIRGAQQLCTKSGIIMSIFYTAFLRLTTGSIIQY